MENKPITDVTYTYFHVYTNHDPKKRGAGYNTGSRNRAVAKGLATRFRNMGFTVELAVRVVAAGSPCICPSHLGNSFRWVDGFDGEN